MNIYDECVAKWKLDELSNIVYKIEDDSYKYIRDNNVKTNNDYKNVLLYTFGKTITTFREIIILCFNGYSDGAFSLARNMYEQLIVLMFFNAKQDEANFQEYIDKYFDDYYYQRSKAIKYEAEKCRKDVEKSNEMNSIINEIKTKWNISKIKDYWWSGLNSFNDMVEYVIGKEPDNFQTRLYELHALYKDACVFIHANCLGNSVRLGTDSKFNVVDNSPNSNGQAAPLYLASMSFWIIYLLFSHNLNLESVYGNKLGEFSSFYNKVLLKEQNNV